jgi:hypothetical protein
MSNRLAQQQLPRDHLMVWDTAIVGNPTKSANCAFLTGLVWTVSFWDQDNKNTPFGHVSLDFARANGAILVFAGCSAL